MKKTIATILSIAVICGCAGCESGNSIFSSVDEEVLNFVDEPSNFNTNVKRVDDGYYFVGLHVWNKLNYHDIESGVTVPLCNKPECDHISESCISGSVDGSFAICGDNIYYIQGEWNNETAEVAIYCTSIDGSTKTKLATCCSVKIPEGTSGWMQQCKMVVHKGKIVFSYGSCVGNNDTERTIKQGISEYDIATGKITEIMTTNEEYFEVRDFIGIGDSVYFSYNYDLMKYDMNTKTLSAIYKEKCSLLRSDGKYLYPECAGYIWKVDPETGEELGLIHKGNNMMYCGTYAVYNGYLIKYYLDESDCGGFIVYDENGNELRRTNVSELVKAENIWQDKVPVIEIGVEKGELLIIAHGATDDYNNPDTRHVNVLFGCNFENYINKTETPKHIFTATF